MILLSVEFPSLAIVLLSHGFAGADVHWQQYKQDAEMTQV